MDWLVLIRIPGILFKLMAQSRLALNLLLSGNKIDGSVQTGTQSTLEW